MTKFKQLLHRYWHDTGAAVAFETVITLPLLALAFISSFVFFDAFRVYNTSVKATYAIADLVSRQTNTLYPSDIEGYSNVFQHLVRDAGQIQMRVTQIYWNGSAYRVDWSSPTNGQARLFDANMDAISDRLPELANSERILLLETWIPYQPSFDVGMDPITFSNFTVTRPRHSTNRVPYSETPPSS